MKQDFFSRFGGDFAFVSGQNALGNYGVMQETIRRTRNKKWCGESEVLDVIWEWALIIVALAFVALVIFLIKTLQAGTKTLENTAQTLKEVQKTMDELTYEVKQIVRHANDITLDANHKLKQLDPVMESVKNLGQLLNEVTLVTQQYSHRMIEKAKHHRENKERQKSENGGATLLPASSESPTVKTYKATYGSGGRDGAAAGANVQKIVKMIDAGASIWQKFRR